MKRPAFVLFAVLALFAFAGCGNGGSAQADAAAAADSGVPADAGAVDDAGVPDAGELPDGGAAIVFVPSIAKMIKDTSVDFKMMVAHRGGAGEAPENTMAAFRHAYETGAHSIEIDTATTKDGVIVIMHDDTLDRSTDCAGPVADKTLAELASCPVDIYDKTKYAGPGERAIPTLDEVFAWVKDKMLVNLDTKGVDAATLAPLIRQHGLVDQVIYQAGSVNGCITLKATDPDIFCLAKIKAIEEIDTVKAELSTNLLQLASEALYTPENMTLIHGRGLKAHLNVLGTYDLVPYQEKVAFMRDGLDIIQTDLPSQWRRVLDLMNR